MCEQRTPEKDNCLAENTNSENMNKCEQQKLDGIL